MAQLTEDERRRIKAGIARLEAATGAEVVTAVIDKSDNYPELPWKAFALGAAIAALARVLLDLLRPDWQSSYATLLDAVLILGCGALFALLTVRIHAIARFFVADGRADAEVTQYAEVFFLRRELFATRARIGVLILVSVFERKVVILPDTGLRPLLTDAALRSVLDAMRKPLAADNIAEALHCGVTGIHGLLEAGGFHAARSAGAGLPDAVIEESGNDAHR